MSYMRFFLQIVGGIFLGILCPPLIIFYMVFIFLREWKISNKVHEEYTAQFDDEINAQLDEEERIAALKQNQR